MVGHFVSLKLRLLRNGLTGNRRRLAGLIAAIVFALPTAVLAFIGLAAMRSIDSGTARFDVAVIGFGVLFLGWVVFPLISFGSDETLDPSRLALLPLTTRELISGLLAASCVGIAPVATAIGLLGAVVGFTRDLVGLVLIAIAVVVELALCVLTSRAVTTTMAGLLRSRKARDLSVLLVAIFGLGFRLVAQFSSVLFEPRHRAAVDTAARWVSLTPPGLAGRAMAEASSGHAGTALVALLGAVLFAVLIGWWWWAVLDNLLTTADTSGPRRRPGVDAPAVRGPLFGQWLTWLPSTRTGAVAAKELRYAVRDPRRRAQLISFLPVVAFPLFSAFASGRPGRFTVLSLPFIAFFVAATLFNQFGLDGAAYGMNVLAGNDPAADLRGKGMASVAVCVPVILPVVILVAALTRGWALVVPALLLTVGFIGVQAGVGAVISVRAPQALPTGKNPWASRGAGAGCTNGFLTIGGMAVEGLLCVPFVIAVLVSLHSAPLLYAVAAASVAYGYAIWRTGIGMATRWVWWRLPELLVLISPKAAT